MMKRFFLISCCTIMLQFAFAQEKVLSLDDAIAVALKNNYDILLAKNDSTGYAVDNSYAYALFLPRLNGAATAVFNTNDQKQKLSNGTEVSRKGVHSNNINSGIALNWTLFDGLKMFAIRDRYKELENLGNLTIKNQVVNTVADVITNYYSIVRQKQQFKAITEQMSISNERVKLADKKLSVGMGAKPELLQAKLDYNAQRSSQLTQQTLIDQLKERLNQVMGISKGINYEVEDTIIFKKDLTLGEIKNNIATTNTELQVFKKNIDILNISLRERKSELWPTVNFNSNYNFSKTNNKEVINSFTPLFNQNAGFNYGLSASIPIFNGFNQRRLIKQADLDIKYQQLAYENQYLQIDVAVNNAFKEYELQKKQLELEDANILLAKENVTIAFERFRLGASTYIELREAQISLADAYNRLIAARYNVKLAETELMRLKGELIK